MFNIKTQGRRGQDEAKLDILDRTDQARQNNKERQGKSKKYDRTEDNFLTFSLSGEITSRLSKDTNLMGRTVCLNVNVLLRTFIKTMGMISLMMNLSWKLTFLVLMETPITGLIQNIYDTHYQVKKGLIRNN